MVNFSGAGAGVLLSTIFSNTTYFHAVDILIFVAFLVLTLVVGISTGGKIKTMQDYALGGKNFSTPTLVASIVATWFGAGIIAAYPEYYAKEGLLVIIPDAIGSFLGLLLMGQVAMRMKEFLNHISSAEVMGTMYGKTVQIISAISGTVFQIGLLAAQFQVMAKVFSLVLDVQDLSLLIIAASVVIFYSAWGGIRAVTFTDVVQFLTFGTFIPILGLVMWSNLQDPRQVAIALAQPQFHIQEVVGWNAPFINALSLTLFFATLGVNPYMFQRVTMARNVQQVKSSFTYAALVSLAVYIAVVWVAVLLLANYPVLKTDHVLHYFIAQPSFMGFKGLLAAGIIALAMSTADSSINTSVTLLTNDVAVPLGLANDKVLTAVRFSTVLVGMLGFVLALYGRDLLSLLFLSSSFYMPIAGMPLLLAVLGFRSNKRSVLISMAAGFATVLLWRKSMAYTGIDALMPATLANAFVLLGSYYLLGEGEGWQQVDTDRLLSRAVWQERKEAIRNFRLYPYLQGLLPVQEGIYTLVGFYAMMATYLGFYTLDRAEIQEYRVIYVGVLLIITSLITFPIWPSTLKNKHFISLFWLFSMGVTLFFVGMLLVILSHFHPLQVMALIFNFLLVALLIRWPMAIILAVSGISSAVLFFEQYTREALPWGVLDSLELRIVYSMFIFIGLLLAFFAYQEAHQQSLRKVQVLLRLDEENKENLLQATSEQQATLHALQYTGAGKLLNIVRSLQQLPLSRELSEQMEPLQMQLLPIAFQFQGLGTRAQEYLRLKIGKLDLKHWCNQIRKSAHERGVKNSSLHCSNLTKLDELKVDGEKLTHLLVNSIVALNGQLEAKTVEERTVILLRIEDTQLSYSLPDVKEGYIKYIPAVRIALTTSENLPVLQESYTPNLSKPADVTRPEDLTKVSNNRIIKSHYGYSEATENTFIYVVPVDVEEVRPQDMDKDFMEIGAELKRSNDHFKNDKGVDAQAQEKAFLADVGKRSKADLGMVRMALETIKWYHGPKERHSGEPFYLHPLTVAHIVLDYNQEEATILGALLHDTVEDTPMQIEHIETMFGKETAEVVDLVTHLQSIPGSIYKIKLSSVENLQMLERTGNKRGLYVKLADRMHNMRTINGHKNVAKRKLIAQETADFFVPLAKRLGLTEAAAEFEQMCYEVFRQQG